ncbi:MAG: FHA domain-containing protein [Sedimentisphaerales bacterium]|nr:FHA domain-containing protein [Sedimentisphaerales bacterium]
MRILIHRGHSLVNDLHFGEGPVYVGRQPRCQVFLPDQSVSRQHAVLFTTHDGIWMVQDLDSANQTLLNGRPVAKMPLHEGDVINICDFKLEVHIDSESGPMAYDKPLDMGDTMVGERSTDASIFHTTAGDQLLRLTPNHLKHFYHLTIALCQQDDQSKLLTTLCQVLLKQYDAYHVWAGLREDTTGPLTCHYGLARGGTVVTLEKLIGRQIVRQAINDETYILLPNVADLHPPGDSTPAGIEKLRSAIAAPIVGPAGAYGVIYVDNGADQKPLTRSDLDYLTLISTQVAAHAEHIG